MPGGFEVEVREIGASGAGMIAERAVAYPRAGGMSFWSITSDGYEEWLLLDAGVARAGDARGVLGSHGRDPRQRGDVVEVADTAGATRMRVAASAAYAAGGRPVATQLEVRGGSILVAEALDEYRAPIPYGHEAREGRGLVVGGTTGAIP